MKYYKIIKDNTFIGAINSDNFIRYQAKNNFFENANERCGEYADCDGRLYRSTWMRPAIVDGPEYIEATIFEITKEEYDSYRAAIAANEEIVIEEPEEETEQIPYVNPLDTISLDFIRSSKLNEMSNTCRHLIEAGFDITLTDGQSHHFSLDTQDQLNLITLSTMIESQEMIPYHADGEECQFYTAAEMKQIIAAAQEFKNYQIAYYNALKAYINALSTIEEIAAITYGMEIPDEYKSEVLKTLE